MNFQITLPDLPVRLVLDSPMGDDDLLSFSEMNDSVRIEREANGEILIMTPTGGRTGKMNVRLGRFLDEWAETDGTGNTFDSDTGFRLPNGAVRSPDASWVSKVRWDALTEKQQDGYIPLCPEFIVELTSPTDRLALVKRKVEEEWMPNGVQVAWLIDAKNRTVTIYRAGEKLEVLFDPTSVQGSGPVRGFELVMSRLW